MAGTPLYADISSYQGTIDWQKYAAWARSFDGTARICMKATEGVGFTDPRFAANRAGALAAGIDSIIFYHYARPDLTNAVAEANWMFHVVGNIREQDVFMLDYEQNTGAATAQWAYDFLSRLETLTGRLPIIYASTSFIQAHLQDARLAKYPLVLANWTYNPASRPACPPPWKSYTYLQYSDKGSVPGITGLVDVNIYLGGGAPVPITTTPGGENAVFIDNIDQLEPGETEDACVAFSAANVFYSTQPGTPNHYTAEQVDQLADKWYVKDTGSITSSAGLTEKQLQDMLTSMGFTWETIPITSNGPANDEAVRTELRKGKLVVICAAEDSFFDLEIGRPPYSWNTRPFNHCIVASGLITSGPWAGNVWVRDTVAVSGGYPPSTKRPYDIAKMQYVSLTAVVPSWLKGGTSMAFIIPTGWHDDGQTLTASNGVPVRDGFRLYIGTHPWDPADVPLAPESAANPVELGYSQPSGPQSGTRQVFMYSELCWTSQRGVYRASVGREFTTALAKLASTSTPTPTPVDTTQAVADVQAIADAVGQAAGAAIAKAVLTIQKL